MSDLLSANITIPISGGGTLAAGTFYLPVMQIPGTANGGGVTLVRSRYSTNAAVGAGSAPAVRLITQTSTGAIIATVAANGSVAYTAGTPISGTISTAWIPGTVGFLGIEYGHGAFGAATMVFLNAEIQYYQGRGSA